MSSSKCKDKTTLTNKQRQDIITYKSKYPNISNVELVDWIKKKFKLDVHSSTIGCLIKNKEDIESNPAAKRQRTVQHPELENTLLEWVLQNQERVILSDAILIEKAKTFAQMLEIPDLKFSQGWLYKFKKRYGLGRVKKHGEDASMDDAVVAAAIPKLKELLEEYDPKDIYNMDETGLEPDTT
ncbi:22072_t:CDS:2 [Cetraspora pellucida]|uniref:22072_t:CDS:1 n=1 Tax=Cetraspora pellucida TaxID=1433469 RepID=A0A9N9IDZ5_9GLOM|nr:22072_t:CDS:2 [Cetraspora pellucida]